MSERLRRLRAAIEELGAVFGDFELEDVDALVSTMETDAEFAESWVKVGSIFYACRLGRRIEQEVALVREKLREEAAR